MNPLPVHMLAAITASQDFLQEDLLSALLLTALFILNVVATGYFVGSTMLIAWFELKSKNNRGCHLIAQAISRHLYTTSPLAWSLIIAPLLIANAIYFLHLASIGSPLLGIWGTMTPVAAMLLLCGWIHRSSWQPLEKGYQSSHAFIAVLNVLLTAILALAYLAKISPVEAQWASLPTAMFSVTVRWVHLMLLSMAGAGLILGWRVGRDDGPLAATLSTSDIAAARRLVLRAALLTLMLQLAAGPLVLMTMHFDYMSFAMGVALLLSLIACVGALLLLSVDLHDAGRRAGRLLPHVTAMMLVAVLSMVMTRHYYRNLALAGHDSPRTLTLASHNWNQNDSDAIRAMPGRKLYMDYCHVCHQSDRLAPTVTEIEQLYRDNPESLIAWAKHPGRKRAQYGPMPPMGHLREDRLKQIADYLLAAARPHDATKPAAQP